VKYFTDGAMRPSSFCGAMRLARAFCPVVDIVFQYREHRGTRDLSQERRK
jgi:hypothetical protein